MTSLLSLQGARSGHPGVRAVLRHAAAGLTGGGTTWLFTVPMRQR